MSRPGARGSARRGLAGPAATTRVVGWGPAVGFGPILGLGPAVRA